MPTLKHTTLGIVVALAFVAFAPHPALAAETASSTPQETFNEFVDDLALAPAGKEEIENYFASLPEATQEAAAADPSTLFTYPEPSSTVSQVSTTSSDEHRVSLFSGPAVRTLQVINRQDVKIAGVTLITFSLSYTYEARGGSVTRNIACNGAASGVISASSSPSTWISQGRGTCEIRTKASVFVKGVPFQFTKVHSVTTQAGNPARVDGRIYTA